MQKFKIMKFLGEPSGENLRSKISFDTVHSCLMAIV